MATVFVLLDKVWETRLIRVVARQAVEAALPKKKKSAPAVTDADPQITLEFEPSTGVIIHENARK